MTIPSNGITPDVIRGAMLPYHLSGDLLDATFDALPPPPCDASAAWRRARVTRLIKEIATFRPADAVQARLAAQILIVRELADTASSRAYAADVTVEQLCRLTRTSAEAVRTTALLVRTLERCQQYPVPFHGTVADEEVDIAAVDAAWGSKHRPAAGLRSGGDAGPDVPPAAVEPEVATGRVEPEPVADAPDAASFAADAGSHGLHAAPNAANAERPVPNAAPPAANVERPVPNAAPSAANVEPLAADAVPFAADAEPASVVTPVVAAAEMRLQRDGSADAAAPLGRHASLTPGSSDASVVTRLDQGPGWTLDVVRPRMADDAARPRTSDDDGVRPRTPDDDAVPLRTGGEVADARA